MSDEIWCDAYGERYDECIEQGLSPLQADIEAVLWADKMKEERR